MRHLGWTTDDRRAVLASRWVRVVDAIRRDERDAAGALRRTA
jgi:hypothetical protein